MFPIDSPEYHRALAIKQRQTDLNAAHHSELMADYLEKNNNASIHNFRGYWAEMKIFYPALPVMWSLKDEKKLGLIG